MLKAPKISFFEGQGTEIFEIEMIRRFWSLLQEYLKDHLRAS